MRERNEQPIHPAVGVALGMTAFVVLGVAMALWPMLRGSESPPPIPSPMPPAHSAANQPYIPQPAVVVQEPLDTPPPAPPPIAVGQPRSQQGIKLELSTADGSVRDARTERLVALYVPQGQSPSPFLPAGPFAATWSGQLNVGLRDRFTFTFEGAGEFELTINHELVMRVSEGDPGPHRSPRVRLRQGSNDVEAVYRSPAGGDARARLLWESFEFPREPVPPIYWTHNAEDGSLLEGARLRRGLQWLAEGRCLRCHTTNDEVAPEFAMDSPSFIEIGARLEPGWVARWVENPRSLRADAQMPRLLHGPTSRRDAADVAAFLATFGGLVPATPRAVPRDAQTVERGAKLYASLGCVGCHQLQAPWDGEWVRDPTRVALNRLGEKYSPHALAAYLVEPQRHYAWTRMPRFNLAEQEAAELTAFLLSYAPRAVKETVHGDAARGKHLVQSLGCVNCHAAPVAGTLVAPTWGQALSSGWLRGCVARSDAERGRAPDFGFTQADRAALLAVANADMAAMSRHVPTEFAATHVAALRCDACHRMDGRADRWGFMADEVAALLDAHDARSEEPAVDQTRPHLTYAGEKLQTEYLRQLLLGQVAESARPWLAARMPAFPAYSHGLAQGLAMSHGLSPTAPQATPAQGQLVEAGAMLVTKQRGFGCVDCHALGTQKAQAVFEAQGVDLLLSAQRLRPQWYERWMLHPLRIEPGTKMPRYADEHGLTPLPELGGDARQQFDAIWHYLHSRHEAHEETKATKVEN